MINRSIFHLRSPFNLHDNRNLTGGSGAGVHKLDFSVVTNNQYFGIVFF